MEAEENTWGWQLTVKVTDLGTLTDLIKSDQVSVVGDIKNLNAPQLPAPRPVPAPTQKLSKFAAPRGPAGNYPYGSRTQEAAKKKQVIMDALERYGGQTTFSELSIAYGNARYDKNGFQGVLEALVKGGYVEKVSKGWYRLVAKETAPDNDNGGDEGEGNEEPEGEPEVTPKGRTRVRGRRMVSSMTLLTAEEVEALLDPKLVEEIRQKNGYYRNRQKDETVPDEASGDQDQGEVS